MSTVDEEITEELTEEQKAHIAVLRRKFFRAVSVFSIFGTIIFLIIMRFTVYNYKNANDYAEYVNHKDKFMRFNAAKALGSYKNDPNATKILIQMLDDPAREVRWHSAASLSKLKDPLSVPKLIQTLNKETDNSAKSIYVYTLGQIRDKNAIEPLKETLNKHLKLKTHEANIVKFSLIQALASFDDKEVNSYLSEIKNNNETSNEVKQVIDKMLASKGQSK